MTRITKKINESGSIESEISSSNNKVNTVLVLGHSLDTGAVKKGYALAVDVLDDVVEEFYAELLIKYPDVHMLFESATEKTQAIKLSDAIKLLIDNIEDESTLVSVLTEMGQSQKKYAALSEHYPVVTEILVRSFKSKIGRSWTKAISSSWLCLLGAVAETMCSVYEEEMNESEADNFGNNSAQDGTIQVNTPDNDVVSGHPVLYLKCVQDISKSQALKNDMLMLVNDNDEIDIDGSSVERIDGTALQLMCALFFYSKDNNLNIHWVEPSDALIRSAEILGVSQVLELT